MHRYRIRLVQRKPRRCHRRIDTGRAAQQSAARATRTATWRNASVWPIARARGPRRAIATLRTRAPRRKLSSSTKRWLVSTRRPRNSPRQPNAKPGAKRPRKHSPCSRKNVSGLQPPAPRVSSRVRPQRAAKPYRADIRVSRRAWQHKVNMPAIPAPARLKGIRAPPANAVRRGATPAVERSGVDC